MARHGVALMADHGIRVVPCANLSDAEKSYAAGESSYLFVMENSRRLIEARVRELLSSLGVTVTS